ncbi:hypothetical protein BC827DRAFT_1265868 [Russula dissimulans]|nr:hypothetical protein BC827DRAFT_1265868 [Russula dissimulans]
MNPAFNSALSIDSNIRRADPTTIKNKFLVGYQGWFYCHGDGEPVGPGHHGWIHWFTYPVPHGGHLNIDYWPDTSQYSREELFVAPGFKHQDGSPAHLFSSRNPKTVQKHFHWMAESGVDGVFLQRFLGLCDVANGGNEGNRRIRDEVGDHVQRAAEHEGRVYAIMYDVTGVQPERVQEVIEADWHHLLRDKRVLNSPNYLREDGKPVIAIWGFGFEDRRHTPAQVRAVTSFFRNSTPGGAYLMAGTPTHWRTSDSDADKNPEFVNTWLESFDAISPWTVGRYSDQAGADAFAEDRLKGDVTFIGNWTKSRGRHVDYVPVVHPGGSGFNLSNGQWARNGAPREGGRFLWRQIYNARKLRAQIMYGAMWDEYDEGTQFMPAITKTAALPRDDDGRFSLIAYDVDGYDVPPDWYMRIAGYGSAIVKGERLIEERFPEKELRNWESKFETRQYSSAGGSGSGSTSGQAQLSSDVSRLVDQAGNQDGPPPPPYSPEAEEDAGVTSVPSRGPEPSISTRPDLPRGDSRYPPPRVPPRLNSFSVSDNSFAPQHGPGPAPPIPLRSRPTVPPRSPVTLEHRPSQSGHHNTPHPLPLLPPQLPTPYSLPDSTGPSSSTLQPPMTDYMQMPQPSNPWYPPPNSQPAWSPQGWTPPRHFPTPGQPMAPLGYPSVTQSEYGDSFAFPGAIRPGPSEYGYATPQSPAILEPYQYNPGPPPPPHSLPSSGHTLPLPPPSPHQPQHHGGAWASPQPTYQSPVPLQHPPPGGSPWPQSAPPPGAWSGNMTRKESLIQKLSSVSAAGSNLLSKLTK